MQLKGTVWKFGNDIDTDVIIPARFLTTSDVEELAKHCMEDADPNFTEKINKGDIIVAGKNFGCGSSREHAPLSIKACGISCVIAASFARIFYRNSINIGLPILECPDAAREIKEGDQVKIDISTGIIENLSNSQSYEALPFPGFMKEIISAGGLMNYVAKKVNKNG